MGLGVVVEGVREGRRRGENGRRRGELSWKLHFNSPESHGRSFAINERRQKREREERMLEG